MSNLGLQTSSDSRPPEGVRHRGRSWVAVLLSLGVLVALGFGVKLAIERIPASGEGTGSVEVGVDAGQSLTEIGRTLKAQDVVASVDAWLAAAEAEPAALKIGPGIYAMAEQMSAGSCTAPPRFCSARMHWVPKMPAAQARKLVKITSGI